MKEVEYGFSAEPRRSIKVSAIWGEIDMKSLKQEIIETVEWIDDDWILDAIRGFIDGMVKGTKYEYIRQDNTQEQS